MEPNSKPSTVDLCLSYMALLYHALCTGEGVMKGDKPSRHSLSSCPCLSWSRSPAGTTEPLVSYDLGNRCSSVLGKLWPFKPCCTPASITCNQHGQWRWGMGVATQEHLEIYRSLTLDVVINSEWGSSSYSYPILS